MASFISLKTLLNALGDVLTFGGGLHVPRGTPSDIPAPGSGVALSADTNDALTFHFPTGRASLARPATGGVAYSTAGGAISVSNPPPPQLTANSLVPGELYSPAWSAFCPAMAPNVLPMAGAAADGTQTLSLINPLGKANTGGYLECSFVVPTGVTGVALELLEVAADPADGAPAAAAVELWDAIGGTRVSTTAFTPGASATVTTGSLEVTAGTEYRMRIVGARCLARSARVRPTVSTDSFWLAFDRYSIDARTLQNNLELGRRLNPRIERATANARVNFASNATDLRVELHHNGGWYLGNTLYSNTRDVAALYVDGRRACNLTPPAPVGITYAQATIPAGAQSVYRASIVSGSQSNGDDASFTARAPLGTYLRAFYVPSNAYVDLERVPVRRVVVYGDSKVVYGGSTGDRNVAEYARALGYDVVMAGIGGQALSGDVGTTLGKAYCVATAQKLSTLRPDIVAVEMGRNDFTQAAFSPADLITQYGNLIDAIHDAAPWAKVLVMAPPGTHEKTETAVSGTAWNVERQAAAALVSSRSAWATLCDVGGLWTSAAAETNYTLDTVHPNDTGYGRITTEIDRVIRPGATHPFSPAESGAIAWWEAGYGLAGAAMGAVTAGGTTPPTVTITGSPVLACRIIVRIREGGARGTATFDASNDGGNRWQYTRIPTAASVEGIFGCTIGFAVGTYNNLHTYYADSGVGNIAPMVGAVSLTPTSGPTFAMRSTTRGTEDRVRLAAGAYYRGDLGAPLSPPFSVLISGKADANTALKALFGKGAGGDGLLVYTTDTSHLGFVFNGQSTASVDVTAKNCLIYVVNGASPKLYVNGVDTAVTGTNSTGSMQTFYVGADSGYGYAETWDWYGCGVWNRAVTADEAYAVAARFRALYGTL